MPIRRYTIDPPFVHANGDVYERQGSTLRQVRGGLVVATRTVPQPVVLQAQFHAGSNQVTEFFEEFRMAGIVQTLAKALRNNTTGVVRFRFADGTELEYGSFEDAVADVEAIDSAPEIARKMLILKTIRNSPDGANLENMVGGSAAIDFHADTPVVVTEPV